MLAKIFKGGLTYEGAVIMIAYLLNERVKRGLAKVVKGDSELTLRIIFQASKKFKWSWISGVLSFSEMLSKDVINSIIKDFERTFFCGMDQSQYNILWVLHIDKGRTELHFIAPRMELRTRKSFNPYYVKRDFGKKDIFQEITNQRWGLSSYLDNQRLTYASRPKWTNNKKTHEELLDNEILALVNKGELSSRRDIIDLLRYSDYEIVNIGTNHIVLLSEKGKKLTLKGAIYSEEFFAGLDILEENMQKYSPPKIGIQDGIIIRESTRNEYKLERALNEIIEKQSYGNRKRYPIPIRMPRWVEIRRAKKNKKQKEKNNDSNRERTIRLIDEERARARKRKRRIAQLTERNLWTKSANHQFTAKGFEQWFENRRLGNDLEKSIRAILGELGKVIQQLSQRNKEALEILKKKHLRKSPGNSLKIRM